MSHTYEIYADEGWTHCGQPLNRYWCFFGGILGPEATLERLNTELKKIKADHSVKSEIKWTAVGANNITCCQAMVDCLFRHIRTYGIKYRQLFLDRALVHVIPEGTAIDSDLTVQFKICYQFLKHAFGLRYMPRGTGKTTVRIRLDDHSSKQHKNDLVAFGEKLPGILNRPDLEISVSFLNSGKHERLQICDIMMGSAGFYGNKNHEHRKVGQRGMTDKQKLKRSLALHVYNQLKNLDSGERGSKNFNWFESTGLQGNKNNMFNYMARIWKFHPSEFRRDRGWENSNLDKHGGYVGPIWAPTAQIERGSESGE